MTPNVPLTQKQINDALLAATTSKIFDSSVPLVVPYGKGIRCIGSGVLLRIKHKFFVITAKHVVEGNQQLIQIVTKLNWCIPPLGGVSSQDFDIAVLEINNEHCDHLQENTFLALSDTITEEISSGAIMTFIGYPSIWVDQDKSELKPIQYTGYRFEDRIPGYKDEHHIFMSAQPRESTDIHGDPVSFKSISGMLLNFPSDLKGISGCGVWVIGDRLTSPDSWKTTDPKLIGLEISVFDSPRAINILRWITVTTLINSAYPEFDDLFTVRPSK